MQIGAGAVVGGKYRLERPLSAGGMGAIWVARHVHLASTVAIKFMNASLAASPTFARRFEREARIAASFKSPHVVQVHDYGIDRGMPYLVMELLEGEDLSTRLQRVGRLALQPSVQVLTQVGKAIRKAHEVGIVHRDLKPGNIFMARVEDEEIVKVLDFGIVKVLDQGAGGPLRISVFEMTNPGDVLGSPLYMSPEQVRGDNDVDHRSDLWSMAIILFRMLTGRLPFAGEQIGHIIASILTQPVPPATGLVPELPVTIEAFFEKALARAREHRFQSVKEMLDALHVVAGEPPRASWNSMPPVVTRPSHPAALQEGWPAPVAGVPLAPGSSPGRSAPPVPGSPGVAAPPGATTLNLGAPTTGSTHATTLPAPNAGGGGSATRQKLQAVLWGLAVGVLLVVGAGGVALHRGELTSLVGAGEGASSRASLAPAAIASAAQGGASSGAQDADDVLSSARPLASGSSRPASLAGGADTSGQEAPSAGHVPADDKVIDLDAMPAGQAREGAALPSGAAYAPAAGSSRASVDKPPEWLQEDVGARPQPPPTPYELPDIFEQPLVVPAAPQPSLAPATPRPPVAPAPLKPSPRRDLQPPQ
ncbi:serine/threonine-protein kinase [Chondromyces crocatus]|uniref:Protein kinase n=1 Tax=Chondromyces crocatus TaxID=52 RepID=A0A0K1E8Y8_CHOCO|nr:serine/threonine-protein kinase [Chondromyces crocatus]AKT37335.1 protein kinase [Chondromyces crocatus]